MRDPSFPTEHEGIIVSETLYAEYEDTIRESRRAAKDVLSDFFFHERARQVTECRECGRLYIADPDVHRFGWYAPEAHQNTIMKKVVHE